MQRNRCLHFSVFFRLAFFSLDRCTFFFHRIEIMLWIFNLPTFFFLIFAFRVVCRNTIFSARVRDDRGKSERQVVLRVRELFP